MTTPNSPYEPVNDPESEVLVVVYTDIVKKHGANSTEANSFRAMHQEDAVFQRRAKVLDMLAQAKDAI